MNLEFAVFRGCAKQQRNLPCKTDPVLPFPASYWLEQAMIRRDRRYLIAGEYQDISGPSLSTRDVLGTEHAQTTCHVLMKIMLKRC